MLRLLLSGARHLGYTLCKQIGQCLEALQTPNLHSFMMQSSSEFVLFLSGTLLAELREYNLEQQRRAHADAHSPDGPTDDSSLSGRLKGKMTSRLASPLGFTSQKPW